MANVVAGQVTITGLLAMGVTTDTAGPTSASTRGANPPAMLIIGTSGITWWK